MKTNQRKNRTPEERYSRVYSKTLNFLSYRNRTQHEITERLDRYLAKERIEIKEKKEIREQIIESLRTDGYIDDSKFLTEYLELIQKSRKPKSILFLKRDLYKKGISNDLIERYLGMLPENYEYKAAFIWGEKKLATIRESDEFIKRQKLINYLKGRGFRFDSISQVLETLPK